MATDDGPTGNFIGGSGSRPTSVDYIRGTVPSHYSWQSTQNSGLLSGAVAVGSEAWSGLREVTNDTYNGVRDLASGAADTIAEIAPNSIFARGSRRLRSTVRVATTTPVPVRRGPASSLVKKMTDYDGMFSYNPNISIDGSPYFKRVVTAQFVNPLAQLFPEIETLNFMIDRIHSDIPVFVNLIPPDYFQQLSHSLNFAIFDMDAEEIYLNPGTANLTSVRWIVVSDGLVGYTDEVISYDTVPVYSLEDYTKWVNCCQSKFTGDGDMAELIPSELRSTKQNKTAASRSSVSESRSFLKRLDEALSRGYDTSLDVASKVVDRGQKVASYAGGKFLPGFANVKGIKFQFRACPSSDGFEVPTEDFERHRLAKIKATSSQVSVPVLRRAAGRIYPISAADTIYGAFPELPSLRADAQIIKGPTVGVGSFGIEIMSVSCFANIVLLDVERSRYYVNKYTCDLHNYPRLLIVKNNTLWACDSFDYKGLRLHELSEYDKWAPVFPSAKIRSRF